MPNDEGGPMPQRFVPSQPPLAGAPKCRILAYGDSLTAGYYDDGNRFEPYGKTLANALAPACDSEVWVCGLSGLEAQQFVEEIREPTITDVLFRRGAGLLWIVQQHGPFDIVIIMGGTNDIGSGEYSSQMVVDNIRALHEACHDVGLRTIALSVPPNGQIRKDTSSPSVLEYCKMWTTVNRLLQEWTQGDATTANRCVFVDTSEIIPYNATNFEDDRLHFSPAGSRRLGERLADIVLPSLQSVQLGEHAALPAEAEHQKTDETASRLDVRRRPRVRKLATIIVPCLVLFIAIRLVRR